MLHIIIKKTIKIMQNYQRRGGGGGGDGWKKQIHTFKVENFANFGNFLPTSPCFSFWKEMLAFLSKRAAIKSLMNLLDILLIL